MASEMKTMKMSPRPLSNSKQPPFGNRKTLARRKAGALTLATTHMQQTATDTHECRMNLESLWMTSA
eukprot:2801619-Alexandrium_andersonii.AAC.1